MHANLLLAFTPLLYYSDFIRRRAPFRIFTRESRSSRANATFNSAILSASRCQTRSARVASELLARLLTTRRVFDNY